jgi:beta-mannosidase
MTSVFPLNGAGWQIKGYLGEDWELRRAYDPQTRDVLGWIPASVPGSIQNDLWQAGKIPNPYYERNSLLIEWVPERTWVYRRHFHAPAEWTTQRVQLRFDGVDYAARFYLNGQLLGSHTGMFTPVEFEVGDKLIFGAENWIAVVVEPAPREQPQVGRTSQVRTHKTRMNYWWDHCTRMVHVGVWDRVNLYASGRLRIEDVFVRPRFDQDFEKAVVSVSVQLSATEYALARIDVRLQYDDIVFVQQSGYIAVEKGAATFRLDVPIQRPQLWWPNGSGGQPLYQADVRVYAGQDSQAAISDQREVTFGIRKIDFVRNPGASPDALPYQLSVNGRPMPILGWNWVPMDVLYGVERPEKLERLLRLAQQAGVNLLRVWGGGLIEKEDFYQACDRLGILVWQEFAQSSSLLDNCPASDPQFVEMMASEARQIIPRKHNHACLAVWCGGNELMSAPDQPLDEAHPVLQALRRVVRELDPDRLWLPSSPSGPVVGYSLENFKRGPAALHDVHGPWEFQGLEGHPRLYNQGASLLHSEFGVEGITNRRALDQVIAPAHQLPVSLANPAWFHLGAWWLKEKTLQATFGDTQSDVDTAVRAAQYLQWDGLRYAVEADRRRYPANAGTLPWQFNEAYPMAASTSAVDYFARPKPAYYAVATAYEPVHVSARFERLVWAGHDKFIAEVWVSNTGVVEKHEALLTARLVDARGTPLHCLNPRVGILAEGSARLAEIDWSLDALEGDVFFLDLELVSEKGEAISNNRYGFTKTENLQPLLHLPQTVLETKIVGSGPGWDMQVCNRGEVAALQVWLEDGRDLGSSGYAYIQPNYFCLFPGESREVRIDWQDVQESERCIELSGWNTQRLVLSSKLLKKDR